MRAPLKRASRLVLTAAALQPTTACAPDRAGEDEGALTERGVSWALAEHRRATLSDVSYRYTLEIPDSVRSPVRGTVRIGFTWDDPDGRPLVLDFVRPGERVGGVSVNGADVPWSAVEDHLVVPADALRQGANELALNFVAGDEALNRSEEFLYALFVPDRAHFSLPLFDQPNLKAPVEWTLTVPDGWRAVTNGPAEETSSTPDGTRTRFRATKPLPTYLFAFAAGRFEEERRMVDGRVMRMYHRETDAEKVARNVDDVFELHARALAWLEEYTGIPYPFQKFDFVLIPSFQYGGMEHPGAILYRQGGLLLDESATQGQLLGRASVIAHETAHMWFGDLVTMNWFDDVWTKEVFANFMAAKVVQPSFPDMDHDLRFLMAHHPSAYGVDRSAGANPVRQPLENLREAGTLYGAIIYQKAPIVMRQLEARVGEETFRDGLREYLQAFAYSNATWPDLIQILDARSDEDLAAWSRVWVEDPGRPRIVVERDGPRVTLRPEDPSGAGRVWPQRLEVALGADDGSVRLREVELGAEPAVLGDVALDRSWVLPNGTGLEYGEFVLDEASREWLERNVGRIEEPVVRGAAWVTLWDQVLTGATPPDVFLEAGLRAVESEPVELVLDRVLGYVETTFWRFLDDAGRSAWAPRLEEVLWAAVQGDRPATARSSLLSAYRDVAVTAEGVDRLRALWTGSVAVPGVPLSETDRIALASALALRGVPDAEEILDRQAREIENPDRRARFDFVRPSLSADPTVRQAFFDRLAAPAEREREPWVLAGVSNLHHPLRAETSLPLIRPSLDLLEEIQETGDIFFPGRWVGATLGGHGSPEALQVVRDFLAARPDLPPRLRAKVEQSADMLERAARWRSGAAGRTDSAGGGR